MTWFSTNHPLFKNRLLIIAGVILHVLAITYGSVYLAWICLVPLFVATGGDSAKAAFRSGALYGLFLGCLGFFWLPVTVLSITGGAVLKAILTGLLTFATYAIFYSLIIGLFSYLKRPERNGFKDALLIAAIWTAGDFLLSSISDGMPWFSMGIGNALLGNLYAIQPAEYGGIYLMGFIVVFVNYLFAHYFMAKQWKKMLIPVGSVVIYMVAGYLILYSFRQRWVASGQPVTVALLTGNISNEEPWNEENGNTLVKRLLTLNEQALRTRPDIVLWPEGVVPWTYRPDDDFVNTILKSTAVLPATYHIMGMNTVLTGKKLYNSAYCFLPDGSIAGRYDKHYLVSMAEQPIRFFSWPVLNKNEEAYYSAGKEGSTLTTSKGRIGVLICNEVFLPKAARAAVTEGAEFLVSLASDAFVTSASSVINQQFFGSRLRAVEVRKDIAVSCNMGISGMIAATGEILYADRADEGATNAVSLTPNKLEPRSNYFNLFIIPVCVIIIFIFSFLNLLKTTTL